MGREGGANGERGHRTGRDKSGEREDRWEMKERRGDRGLGERRWKRGQGIRLLAVQTKDLDVSVCCPKCKQNKRTFLSFVEDSTVNFKFIIIRSHVS